MTTRTTDQTDPLTHDREEEAARLKAQIRALLTAPELAARVAQDLAEQRAAVVCAPVTPVYHAPEVLGHLARLAREGASQRRFRVLS